MFNGLLHLNGGVTYLGHLICRGQHRKPVKSFSNTFKAQVSDSGNAAAPTESKNGSGHEKS